MNKNFFFLFFVIALLFFSSEAFGAEFRAKRDVNISYDDFGGADDTNWNSNLWIQNDPGDGLDNIRSNRGDLNAVFNQVYNMTTDQNIWNFTDTDDINFSFTYVTKNSATGNANALIKLHNANGDGFGGGCTVGTPIVCIIKEGAVSNIIVDNNIITQSTISDGARIIINLKSVLDTDNYDVQVYLDNNMEASLTVTRPQTDFNFSFGCQSTGTGAFCAYDSFDVNGIDDYNRSFLDANFTAQANLQNFDPGNEINSILVDLNSISTELNVTIDSYSWLVDSVEVSTDENVQRIFQANKDYNISLIINATSIFAGATPLISQKDLNFNLNVPDITLFDFNISLDPRLSALPIDNSGNMSMICNAGGSDVNYTIELNDVNIFAQLVANNFELHLADRNFLDGVNTINYYCFASSGLYDLKTIDFDFFNKFFFFAHDNTGVVVASSAEYATSDINSVFVYSFDSNLLLDLFTDNEVSFYAIGDENTAIQIRIGYDDPTFPFTSRDFELDALDVNKVPVCFSGLQTFYQNVFFSSIARQIRLINANTGCYHAAATTKFAFLDSISISSFLIPQSYNLYILEDGSFALLAIVDGSSAGQINIDALIIKRNSALEIRIPSEAVTIQKDCGELSDCNTFNIRYRNEKGDNSKAVATVFNGLLPQFSHTETTNPNNFAVTFDATDLNFWDANVLKLTVVATRTDGTTKTFTIFFTPQGQVGFIDPAIAVILSFVIFIGGISLVSARIVFGWFGMIVALIAVAFLSFSVGVWWLSFMQAVMIAMLLYIGITFSQTQSGAT